MRENPSPALHSGVRGLRALFQYYEVLDPTCILDRHQLLTTLRRLVHPFHEIQNTVTEIKIETIHTIALKCSIATRSDAIA